MKYAIILPDGAADLPIDQLDHRTPLQTAHTPNMDSIADNGLIGRVRTTPEGFAAGSDVCTLSLMGVDVNQHYTGRAPIEAAGRGIALNPGDLAFRCNLVTIRDDRMIDFTAGHITQDDASVLINVLKQQLDSDSMTFHQGVQYRHLLILHGAASLECECTPPHDIPNQPIPDHLPKGRDSQTVRDIMQRAASILTDHPVNRKRAASGRNPATNIWLWGQGITPTLKTWPQRFGLRCAGIAAVDLIRGIDRLLGFDLIHVPTATGYLDTDYAAKGRAAVDAIDKYDVVSVHVEAPDEAGHLGDAAAKVAAIEQIDAQIVGPVLDRLRQETDWRILIAPDHPTCVATRVHSADPPPFAIAGSGVEPSDQAASQTANQTKPQSTGFNEQNAASGLFEPIGHNLVNRFII